MDFSNFYSQFQPCITTVDSHTEGESTRLIIDGLGEIPGTTMGEKLDFFETRLDWVRLSLTREPRGHKEILAAAVTKPVSPGAAFGLLYMDAKRYPFLCGHATIGAVVTLHKIGMLDLVPGENTLLIDTPSGIMESRAVVAGNRILSVSITMVPSFVLATGKIIHVNGFGDIPVDLVCTGGFFAMVSSEAVGIQPVIENRYRLADLGMKIIEAANEQLDVFHPERHDVTTVDVTEFYDPGFHPETCQGRGMVIYGESHVDRSPCGTGTAAKLTLLNHYRKLGLNQTYRNYSPLGTCFEAEVVEKTRVGNFEACIVMIRANAYVTGIHHFIIDPDDPLKEGFLI